MLQEVFFERLKNKAEQTALFYYVVIYRVLWLFSIMCSGETETSFVLILLARQFFSGGE